MVSAVVGDGWCEKHAEFHSSNAKLDLLAYIVLNQSAAKWIMCKRVETLYIQFNGFLIRIQSDFLFNIFFNTNLI